MKRSGVGKKRYLALGVIVMVTLIVGLVACSPNQQPATNNTQQEVQQPEPDSFGVIQAAQWAEAYPAVYQSYLDNEMNSPDSGKHDYLELYPALHTLYAGFGFSKGYDEAASHLYSLDSIKATPRVNEKTLANCITCKSPQFTALVNNNGDEEYAKPFADTLATITETISCYNCHENDPETLTVGNKFFVTALGNDYTNVPEQAAVCGQCHNEYYFSGDNKATTNPYTGLKEMSPDAILAYYDEKGFSDWLYPGTDTPMIKVQHPEFETVYGGGTPSRMAQINYSCADCHMGTAADADGSTYTSHFWQSPLENKELLESNCNSCHTDLKAQVTEWQTASEARVQSISLKIEDMVNKMVAQVADGTLSGDKLAQLQKLHRNAQFYWDFVMVENSEGAHNVALANDTLDKAEAAVDEALSML